MYVSIRLDLYLFFLLGQILKPDDDLFSQCMCENERITLLRNVSCVRHGVVEPNIRLDRMEDTNLTWESIFIKNLCY